jgi:CheY-like chemotaxis protein
MTGQLLPLRDKANDPEASREELRQEIERLSLLVGEIALAICSPLASIQLNHEALAEQLRQLLVWIGGGQSTYGQTSLGRTEFEATSADIAASLLENRQCIERIRTILSEGCGRVATLAEVRRRRPRVLLVDDEGAMLSAMQRALRGRLEVVAVAGGQAAIDVLLADQDFDLILCDVMMPEVGGKQVFEQAQRSNPDLPRRLVFMTGGVFTSEDREFLTAAGARVLQKPMQPEEVFRLVAEGACAA